MSRKFLIAGALLALLQALVSPLGHAAARGPSSADLPTSGHLKVQVPLEGRPAPPSELLEGTVYYHLTRGDAIDLYDKTTTDENGIFVIDVRGQPEGQYSLWVKNLNNLASAAKIVLPDALSKPVTMQPLMAGDANGDNVVNSTDFGILRLTFNKSDGQPGYDKRADFNGDDVVSISDFQLLRSHFGAAGACEPGTAFCP